MFLVLGRFPPVVGAHLDQRAATLQRIDALVGGLKPQPYIVRLAYAAMSEPDALIQVRMRALQSALRDAWQAHDRRDALRSEEEILRPTQPNDAGESKP